MSHLDSENVQYQMFALYVKRGRTYVCTYVVNVVCVCPVSVLGAETTATKQCEQPWRYVALTAPAREKTTYLEKHTRNLRKNSTAGPRSDAAAV